MARVMPRPTPVLAIDPPSVVSKDAPPVRPAGLVELLVVDDDADLREVLSDVLREAGYNVRTAIDGRDALARVRGGPLPDLIVVDLLMPEMNGWAFIAELKASPELAAIPVVVTTAAGDTVLNSAPVCAGYLSKPLGQLRLLETVARCLSFRLNRSRP
jgi:CheY-like chemotaxis protein